MLELKDIKKDYVTSNETVRALKGISIKFRENEFVAILGQSGCGKTTLLNIIGGLDHYTSGDLIINGKSTKEFKDKDWDTYRNHSIGFVFQSYNLIPHQSILSNVELALTISGVSKKERKKRAIEALEKVGLGDKIHKRPNELSGGQMQRVAIARAIVNNPDIILADEPTGALDTKTSVQVMDILKEISKEHLIIMVTHNPDLAEKYATRTVKILDGNIIDDSNPYDGEKENQKEDDKKKKPSMSFLTALSLSLNNLMTKKGRTILTAFAGSIGIIGIALILSLSAGVQNYINSIEEDTLASYPVTLQESTIDLGGMMTSLMDTSSSEENINQEANTIYSRNIMDSMLTAMSSEVKTNNLAKFKEYIENTDKIKPYANAIKYSYDLDLNIYKSDTTNGVVQVNPSQVMNRVGMETMVEAGNQMYGSTMMSDVNVFSELFDNQEMLDLQYELLQGKWPENYNEVVVIVDKDNEISDYTLYSLGLKNQDELEDKMNKIQNGEEVEKSEETSYTYDDLLNLSFKLLLNADLYNKENGAWVDKSENEEYLKEKLENAEELKVVGIIKQKEESVSSNTQGGIGYTKDLTEYVANKANETEIVKEQKDNPDVNVFTGLDFPKDGEEEDFSLDSLTTEQKMALASMNAEDLSKLMEAYTENSEASYENNLEKLGVIDLNSPSAINIYPKDFDSKEAISNSITEYNNNQENENDKINYTDTIGIMMSSVSTIVDTISYVLIAFVAISLIVSSIMIGIITYISVLERTKEIGILRAIGASKKDISRVFNAETFITGLVSGLIGIGVTVLLTIPINSIIMSVTGVNVEAFLPWQAGIILVLISMFLTMIAGLIPAKMASKRDPVRALRTE